MGNCFLHTCKHDNDVDLPNETKHARWDVRVETPYRARLAATLPRLRQQGFKLLALDFDLTIIDQHTGGEWPSSSESLLQHVRPEFAALMRAALDAKIELSVVTFSGQAELIRGVLQGVLGRSGAERVWLRCADGNWDPNVRAAGESWGLNWEDGAMRGKMKHLCSVWQAAGHRNARIGPGHTILIDDDANNIDAASYLGVSAIYFDVSSDGKTDQLLAALKHCSDVRRTVVVGTGALLGAAEQPNQEGQPTCTQVQECCVLQLRWLLDYTAAQLVAVADTEPDHIQQLKTIATCCGVELAAQWEAQWEETGQAAVAPVVIVSHDTDRASRLRELLISSERLGCDVVLCADGLSADNTPSPDAIQIAQNLLQQASFNLTEFTEIQRVSALERRSHTNTTTKTDL